MVCSAQVGQDHLNIALEDVVPCRESNQHALHDHAAPDVFPRFCKVFQLFRLNMRATLCVGLHGWRIIALVRTWKCIQAFRFQVYVGINLQSMICRKNK